MKKFFMFSFILVLSIVISGCSKNTNEQQMELDQSSQVQETEQIEESELPQSGDRTIQNEQQADEIDKMITDIDNIDKEIDADLGDIDSIEDDFAD